MRTEIHPFEAFVPDKAAVLVLGSFPGKESTQQERPDDWYYGASRNQFWKILEIVYDRKLNSRDAKQALFREYGIAITDILKSCVRADNSASDKNLTDKVYNTKVITTIIETNEIEKILFTSKGVHDEFTAFIEPSVRKKSCRKVVLITPSAVYRRDSIEQKAEKYKKEFPLMTIAERRARFQDRFGGSAGLTILDRDH